MQMSEITFEDAQPIEGYGPGFFRVGGHLAQGNVIVRATGVVPWGGLDDVDALLALSDDIDVILLGTGAEMDYIPPALRQKIEAAGMGVEPMATPSACRTYNVLVSEERRVAAALIALPAAT